MCQDKWLKLDKSRYMKGEILSSSMAKVSARLSYPLNKTSAYRNSQLLCFKKRMYILHV